jgi:hypothetical protein
LQAYDRFVLDLFSTTGGIHCIEDDSQATINTEVIHQEALCTAFVEITRCFLEQGVYCELEVEFLGLKLRGTFR